MANFNKTGVSRVEVATSNDAYASGDAIGGKLTFSGLSRDPQRSGAIFSVQIVDAAKIGGAVDLVLFRESFTPTADNAAMNIGTADAFNCVGYVSIAASDYVAIGGAKVATKTGFGLGYTAGDGNLYGQLRSNGNTGDYNGTALWVTVSAFVD